MGGRADLPPIGPATVNDHVLPSKHAARAPLPAVHARGPHSSVQARTRAAPRRATLHQKALREARGAAACTSCGASEGGNLPTVRPELWA